MSKGSNVVLYKTLAENLTPETREQFFHQVLSRLMPGAIVKDYSYSDLKNVIKIRYKFTVKNLAERIKDILIIRPMSIGRAAEDYAKTNRFYDLELNQRSVFYKKEKIIVPDGFKVGTVPQPYKNENDYLISYVKYATEGNTLDKEVKYAFPKLTIPKEAYAEFKAGFDEFVFEANKNVILEKE